MDSVSHGAHRLQSLAQAEGQLVSSHSFCWQNKDNSTLATDIHTDTGINQTLVCLPLNQRVMWRWGEEFAVVFLRGCIPNFAWDNSPSALNCWLLQSPTDTHTYSGKVFKLSHLYSFYFDSTGIIKGMCKRGEPVAEMKLNFFPHRNLGSWQLFVGQDISLL